MSDAAPTPLPDDASATVSADGRPLVIFQHSFFSKLEDAYFQLSEQTNEPVMVIKFAKNEVSLPFKGIKREFSLADDSADAQMLETVTKALKYVKGIRIGEALPKELLTGEASWDLSDRHIKIAYQRISVQLVNWMTGGQNLITDPDELLQLAEDPQTKKAINLAFGEAAEKLGLGRDHKEEVIHYVQTLAHELAYIEALRDRFRHIEAMENKIQAFRRLYGRERSVLEIADQVARLGERAVDDFKELFLEVDAQTGEILSVLRNLQSQIAYIREKRDELYAKLMAWDEILAEWDVVAVKIGPEKPDLLRRAYHFLAPRFMMVNEWVLMTKPNRGGDAVSQLAEAEKKKKKVPIMRW